MVTSDRRGERERSENVHKLSPAATKNADCYRTMTRPVNNMIMRSEYNSKQQSNKPPNLGWVGNIRDNGGKWTDMEGDIGIVRFGSNKLDMGMTPSRLGHISIHFCKGQCST